MTLYEIIFTWLATDLNNLCVFLLLTFNRWMGAIVNPALLTDWLLNNCVFLLIALIRWMVAIATSDLLPDWLLWVQRLFGFCWLLSLSPRSVHLIGNWTPSSESSMFYFLARPQPISEISNNKTWLIARRLRATIVLFRIQAWNFPHLLRLVTWWFLDIEPLQQSSSALAQGKIHFRYRKFGLTWLHKPIFAFNMVKNRPTISLDVLKDINKYIFKKLFP